MLLAGDESRRTQQGNNNAYCQDNQISWVDWELAKTNSPLIQFVQKAYWLAAQVSRAPSQPLPHWRIHRGVGSQGRYLDQCQWI